MAETEWRRLRQLCLGISHVAIRRAAAIIFRALRLDSGVLHYQRLLQKLKTMPRARRFGACTVTGNACSGIVVGIGQYSASVGAVVCGVRKNIFVFFVLALAVTNDHWNVAAARPRSSTGCALLILCDFVQCRTKAGVPIRTGGITSRST